MHFASKLKETYENASTGFEKRHGRKEPRKGLIKWLHHRDNYVIDSDSSNPSPPPRIFPVE